MSPWLEGAIVGLVASVVVQVAPVVLRRLRGWRAARAMAVRKREAGKLGPALAMAHELMAHCPGTIRWLAPSVIVRGHVREWGMLRTLPTAQIIGTDAWSLHERARALAARS